MGYIKVTQGGDWIPVLEAMVRQLQQRGFHRGQIYSIDVHNNGPDADGIVSAHWTGEPVGHGGTAYIGFEILNDTNSWHNHYSWADQRADALRRAGKRIISVSNTANSSGRGLTVVWFEH